MQCWQTPNATKRHATGDCGEKWRSPQAKKVAKVAIYVKSKKKSNY
jgi:hypothetical protein